jgi:AcrR family transcriptional regulator
MAPTVPLDQQPQQHRDHRTRLLEAIATSVRERGLRGTTVADVVRIARVSRRTFYQHFDDLIDCYLELMRLLGDQMLDSVRDAVESGGTTDERIDRAVDRYVELLTEEPELSRSYWLEYHLTGERGHGSIVSDSERTAQLFGRLAEELRATDPGRREPLPLEALVMLNGAIRELTLHLFEHDLPPRDAHATIAWMVRLVARADPPGPSGSAPPARPAP